ncbi:05835e87-1a36-4e86-bac8-1803a1313188 [Thermothielavioides terrestris]|uniref:05835e87-1a36-4e86-bac8-1803a1313188 n=1 Tax=Thermothielavioides terrestris TaxID=2587410 RepID=A0A446B8B6_9PEZI|nr:05835e87-1a36-4e86-bac8-1803a1313188 [Thermothielavioides terrestris]
MADNIPSGNEYRTGRSDSTSSATSTGSATAPPYRRSSRTLSEGLTAQKRKDDPVSIARRQSLNEQRPQPGFFGQMWNK